MNVGRFELIAPLGSGGVAEVWRARQAGSRNEVAIKRLLPQFAADRQVRRRFLREGEVAARLAHPNIVRVLDSGEADGRPFLVMELVEGQDLGQRLEREGKLPQNDSWLIAIAVAEALGHAHAQGIVHCDLKPQNVMLGKWTVKLTDFGLARVETFASLTGSSLLWGSPEYMAPELFLRGRVDPRTDLFSLGVLLHEMVTGKLPWKEGRSAARVAGDRARPLPSLGQGAALDALVTALLSAAPDARPASAAEVIAMLTGTRLVPPPVRLCRCAACGVDGAEDVPRCLTCGHEELVLRHTPDGRWDVVITGMGDDAESMAALQGALTELTGRDDLELKFLLGPSNVYSKEEQKEAISLPAVAFSHLDEATAKAIADRLEGGKLVAVAAKRSALGTWTRQKVKRAWTGLGLFALLGIGIPMLMAPAWARYGRFVVSFLLAGGVGLAIPLIDAVLELRKKVGRFQLRAAAAPAPAAERLLAAASETGARLATPDVRALFSGVARELFRLTRRAEELAGRHRFDSTEAQSARRLLTAAPALGARLAAVAGRLQSLDVALDGQSEGDTARALGALARREASADADDRAALAEVRRELEVTLDRRLVAEAERERLAASLCRVLATVREVYSRAALKKGAEERDAAALEEALRELAAT